MLHLRSGLVRFLMAAFFACFSKAKLPDDPTQRGIADIDAVIFTEHLMSALNPAVALVINTVDQFGVDLDLIASGNRLES